MSVQEKVEIIAMSVRFEDPQPHFGELYEPLKRPRTKPINFQDSFLFGSLKDGRVLAFALVTGKAFKGQIKRFDRYAVVVDDGALDMQHVAGAGIAILLAPVDEPHGPRSPRRWSPGCAACRCCSEALLENWWVKDEIRKAQEGERRDGRDIIIPLMVDRYLLDSWEDGPAADLRSRLAADFTGWEHDNARFEEQFGKVVRALRTDEGAREKAPEPKL